MPDIENIQNQQASMLATFADATSLRVVGVCFCVSKPKGKIAASACSCHVSAGNLRNHVSAPQPGDHETNDTEAQDSCSTFYLQKIVVVDVSK